MSRDGVSTRGRTVRRGLGLLGLCAGAWAVAGDAPALDAPVGDAPAIDAAAPGAGGPGPACGEDARAASGSRGRREGELRPSADLYCVTLTPVPGFTGSAVVELGRIPGPFTAAVTPDGRLRYAPTLELAGLPPAGELGPYEGYVAWVTTPTMHPEERLGVARPGTTRLPPIELEKFVILVTAEPDTAARERAGRLLFRGSSPSTRMQPADVLEFTLGSRFRPTGAGAVREDGGEHDGAHGRGAAPEPGAAPGPGAAAGSASWLLPPMPEGLSMLPAMMELRPEVGAYLPAGDPLPARPHEIIRLEDGDTLALEAGVVERRIGGHTVRMYAYNGQYPGPLVWVARGSTITVDFRNRIDQPTTVHWHGLRLDNRFDGVPGVTQAPVAPGEDFIYEVTFPDAGLYWYHPHVREDVQQDLGLYGNLMVRDARPEYYGPAHREEVLMLDDLLVAPEGVVPFGRERATHGFMGRFGNVFLVNGEPAGSGAEPGWELDARRGEVVRLFLTNVANTRTFNLSFVGPPGVSDRSAPMKVVGSDVGLYEREERVSSVVIAPAERYIAHVRFDEPGTWALVNRVRGLDHLYGTFFPEVDTLGVVRVAADPAPPGPTRAFDEERAHPWVTAEVDRYREAFDRPVDLELELALETGELPFAVERVMQLDSAYFHPVEWSGTMPMMNWASTAEEARWKLVEPSTGREDMDIRWEFRVGEVAKIRLANRRHSLHAMQHPIHFHGQRFLVLAVNGVPNDNLVWKDTVLVPVGATVDLLLEASNPGRWMAHCHIAEHLEAGMMLAFTVR